MTSAPDMIASIAPRSDQINAEDLLTGPRTVTITEVARGTSEQPVNFVTAEFGPERPYKPSKTMRRIIVAAWGKNTADYVGRRMTIYRDPDVTFGRDRVGGIKISHLSHINSRLELALTVTRGKRSTFTVDPLPDTPAAIDQAAATEFEQRIANAATTQELDAIAKDLKARDLGGFRERLMSAGRDRRAALTRSTNKSPEENQEGVGADNTETQEAAANDPYAGAEPGPTPDVKMATRQQITQLKQIRQAEKYDTDEAWSDYLFNLTGARVTADKDLTTEQAQSVINEFSSK